MDINLNVSPQCLCNANKNSPTMLHKNRKGVIQKTQAEV